MIYFYRFTFHKHISNIAHKYLIVNRFIFNNFHQTRPLVLIYSIFLSRLAATMTLIWRLAHQPSSLSANQQPMTREGRET